MGDLQKSKYYNDRMIRGKAEAKFSVVRKIAAANTVKTQKKPNEFGTGGTSGMKSSRTIGKEFKELFSETIKDYSLINKVEDAFLSESPTGKHLFPYIYSLKRSHLHRSSLQVPQARHSHLRDQRQRSTLSHWPQRRKERAAPPLLPGDRCGPHP